MGIGIDISESHTILVELTRSGGAFALGRSAILPGFEHRAGALAASAANSPLAGAIESVPGALRKSGAYISMPGRDVIFRVVETGADTPGAMRALARLEAETISGGAATMTACQKVFSPGGEALALIGIAREEVVEHYAGSLGAAGLRPGAFVPGPVALYHCYLMSGDLDTAGVTLVANIGEMVTDVVLVSGGDLLLARTLPIGVNTFIEGIASDLAVNTEQARETLFKRIDIKPGVADVNVSGERAVASAQDAAAQLFAQLNGVTAVARGLLRSPGLEVPRVTLAGPGAAIRGMREFLAGRMRKSVERLDPLKGVDLASLDEDAHVIVTSYAAALALPLGLARMACEEAEGRILFVPPSVVARRRFFGRTVWLYAGVLLMLLALAATIYSSKMLGSHAEDIKQRAVTDTAGYRVHHAALLSQPPRPGAPAIERIGGMSEIQRDILKAEQRLMELTEARRPGMDALRLFIDMLGGVGGKSALPPEIVLRRFSLEYFQGESGGPRQGILVEFFVENAGRKPDEVEAQLRDLFKGHPVVAELAPALSTPEVDGSGYTGSLRVYLRDVGDMLTASESAAKQ